MAILVRISQENPFILEINTEISIHNENIHRTSSACTSESAIFLNAFNKIMRFWTVRVQWQCCLVTLYTYIKPTKHPIPLMGYSRTETINRGFGNASIGWSKSFYWIWASIGVGTHLSGSGKDSFLTSPDRASSTGLLRGGSGGLGSGVAALEPTGGVIGPQNDLRRTLWAHSGNPRVCLSIIFSGIY